MIVEVNVFVMLRHFDQFSDLTGSVMEYVMCKKFNDPERLDDIEQTAFGNLVRTLHELILYLCPQFLGIPPHAFRHRVFGLPSEHYLPIPRSLATVASYALRSGI
jgi:hypothetical protein